VPASCGPYSYASTVVSFAASDTLLAFGQSDGSNIFFLYPNTEGSAEFTSIPSSGAFVWKPSQLGNRSWWLFSPFVSVINFRTLPTADAELPKPSIPWLPISRPRPVKRVCGINLFMEEFL
jgi:hypothetical protein